MREGLIRISWELLKIQMKKLNEEMILNYYSFGQCRGAWKEFTLSDKYPKESFK